jgi:hypothetical protein
MIHPDFQQELPSHSGYRRDENQHKRQQHWVDSFGIGAGIGL